MLLIEKGSWTVDRATTTKKNEEDWVKVLCEQHFSDIVICCRLYSLFNLYNTQNKDQQDGLVGKQLLSAVVAELLLS